MTNTFLIIFRKGLQIPFFLFPFFNIFGKGGQRNFLLVFKKFFNTFFSLLNGLAFTPPPLFMAWPLVEELFIAASLTVIELQSISNLW